MVAAGLPSFTGVIAKFLFLDPYRGFRKQIDSAQMIPMRVADHDVGDFRRLYASQLHRFIRAKVISDGPLLEPFFAVESTVEENVVPSATDQPDGENSVDFFVLR